MTKVDGDIIAEEEEKMQEEEQCKTEDTTKTAKKSAAAASSATVSSAAVIDDKEQPSNNNDNLASDKGGNTDSTPSTEEEENEGQGEEAPEEQEDEEEEEEKPIKLYKSSRLKGYITLALASFINYDAASKSANVRPTTPAVASNDGQRRYAEAVAVLSMIFACFSVVCHLDRFTPLEKVWIKLYKPGSKFEWGLISFLVVWWSVGTGVNTSVSGIAGDGKGQYSLYYSTWVCCITCYWMLERWGVAAGWASSKSFISSWPNRAPAWICIMVLGLATLIWYVDLWQNHEKLVKGSDATIYRRSISEHFANVGDGQWQWLVIVAVITIVPAIVFSVIELFRETKADGGTAVKPRTETIIEGVFFLFLVLAWIPTVMIATTPGGAASLVGNAYFFTWFLTIFVFEGLIWYIHDMRKETHYALKEKEEEYHKQQMKVLENTLKIQQKHDDELLRGVTSPSSKYDRTGTEIFDSSFEDSPNSRS